jgi:hypothetical protein
MAKLWRDLTMLDVVQAGVLVGMEFSCLQLHMRRAYIANRPVVRVLSRAWLGAVAGPYRDRRIDDVSMLSPRSCSLWAKRRRPSLANPQAIPPAISAVRWRRARAATASRPGDVPNSRKGLVPALAALRLAHFAYAPNGW